MSAPELQIQFQWHFRGRSYHISFVITVQKSVDGGNAEKNAKVAFAQVTNALLGAGVHFNIDHLILRDRPGFYVVECGGRVDDRELTRRVLTESGDLPWRHGESGTAAESTEPLSS